MRDVELSIAITGVRFDDGTLPERIKSAMRDVRKREPDIFFMSGRVDDDLRIRTALGAVLSKCSDEDRDVIERSLKPLRMLSAAAQGIPVDFEQMDMSDDLLPILGMWYETEPTP